MALAASGPDDCRHALWAQDMAAGKATRPWQRCDVVDAEACPSRRQAISCDVHVYRLSCLSMASAWRQMPGKDTIDQDSKADWSAMPPEAFTGKTCGCTSEVRGARVPQSGFIGLHRGRLSSRDLSLSNINITLFGGSSSKTYARIDSRLRTRGKSKIDRSSDDSLIA